MINTLQLLRGESIQITPQIIMNHPTLQEIIDYGEENYNNAINLFCMKPYDLMVELDDLGIDFRTLSDFDLFVQLLGTPIYKDAIKFWIGQCEFKAYTNTENGELVLFDEMLDLKIDRYIYGNMAEYVRQLHFISDKREFNVENDIAVQFLIEEERGKRKRQSKKPKKEFESQLSNTISFFCWNNNSGYSLRNVWDLKVYQFYDGIQRLHKTDHYKNTMLGVYTGNVDGSKIDMESINWAGKIKI